MEKKVYYFNNLEMKELRGIKLLNTMIKLRSQSGQPYTVEETSALKEDIFNVLGIAADEQMSIAQERARKQYERERLGE